MRPPNMKTRGEIRKLCKRLGIHMYSLTYDKPAHMGFGDYSGGWLVKTSVGDYGGTPEVLVQWLELRAEDLKIGACAAQ